MKSNKKPVLSKQFELSLDYSFLATSGSTTCQKRYEDATDSTKKSSTAGPMFRQSGKSEKTQPTERPDTEFLWALGESESHKHLLSNPVIALFIEMKWQKIEPIYRRGQRFLFFFTLIQTWFILAMFGGKSTRKRELIHPNEKEVCSTHADVDDFGAFGVALICIPFIFLVTT